MKKTGPPALRFQPSPWAATMHLLLFAGVFALFLGRKPGAFHSQAIADAAPGFYSHVFNLSLSWFLYAGVGFLWLAIGVPMRHLALAGLALVMANVAYECLLPLMNTRDPMDAAYGVAGTLLAFAWLWIVRRFGLKPRAATH